MVNILEAFSITKNFGGLKAVDSVSINVSEGEIFSIIGPNGAGKTTFFNCLTGVYKPNYGSFSFNGRNITNLSPHQISRTGISRTFQNIRLFKEMSVIENVLVGMHTKMKSGWFSSIIKLPGAAKEERKSVEEAMKLLEFVGLEKKINIWARELAYGEQRRLEIARALASKPILLLLDEPAAGMNPVEIDELMKTICKIRDLGITIILIEHHMQVVMGISDRIAVLNYGVKIAEGKPDVIQNDENVIEAYLGRGEN